MCAKYCGNFFKNLEIKHPYDLEIPLLSIHPKDMETWYQSDTWSTILFVPWFTIAKVWNITSCPSPDEWIKKISRVHTHTHTHRAKHYAAIKWLKFSQCSIIHGLEDMALSKIRQTEKDKHQTFFLHVGAK